MSKRKVNDLSDTSEDEDYDPRSHVMSQSSSSEGSIYRIIETDSDQGTFILSDSESRADQEEIHIQQSIINDKDDQARTDQEEIDVQLNLDELSSNEQEEINLDEPNEESIFNKQYAKSLLKDQLQTCISNGDSIISYSQMKKQAEFWTNYNRVIYGDSETFFVICKVCNSLFKYTGKDGTTSISSHSSKCKPMESNQQLIDTMLLKKMNRNHKDVLINAAALCSAIDSRAFSTFDGRFIEYSNKLV